MLPTSHEVRAATRDELGDIVSRLGLRGVIPTAKVKGRTKATILEDIFSHELALAHMAEADARTLSSEDEEEAADVSNPTAWPGSPAESDMSSASTILGRSPSQEASTPLPLHSNSSSTPSEPSSTPDLSTGLATAFSAVNINDQHVPPTAAASKTSISVKGITDLKENTYRSCGQRVDGLADQLMICVKGGDAWFPGQFNTKDMGDAGSGFSIESINGFPNGPISAFYPYVVEGRALVPNPIEVRGAHEILPRSSCKGEKQWRREYFYAYGGTEPTKLTRYLNLADVTSLSLKTSDWQLRPTKPRSNTHEYRRVLCHVELRPVEMAAALKTAEAGIAETFLGATNLGGVVTRHYLQGHHLVSKQVEYDEETAAEKELECTKKDLGAELRLGLLKEVRMELPMVYDKLFDRVALERGTQLCSDLDATAEVWNGVLTTISKHRVHSARDAAGAVTTEWKVQTKGRFGLGSHAHYLERRDLDGRVTQAFKSLWDGENERPLADESLDSQLGRMYVDTLWHEAPQVFVWGRPSDRAAVWINQKMLQYGIIADNAQAHPPSAEYIEYIFAMLLVSIRCRTTRAFVLVGEKGELYECANAEAYAAAVRALEDGASLSELLPAPSIEKVDVTQRVKPGGPNGRCEATFFEQATSRSFRPALAVELTDAIDPCAEPPATLPSLTEWRGSSDVNGFERAVYRALIEHWGHFSAMDVEERELRRPLHEQTSDKSFYTASIRCQRLRAFFKHLEAGVGLSEQQKAVVAAVQELAFANPTAWAAVDATATPLSDAALDGLLSGELRGRIDFDNYNTLTYWSFKEDDAFCKYLDARSGATAGEPYCGLLQALNSSETPSPWAERVVAQATAHLQYVMRRKYVAKPYKMGTADAGSKGSIYDANLSLELGAGAFLCDVLTGTVLSPNAAAMSDDEETGGEETGEETGDEKGSLSTAGFCTAALARATAGFPAGTPIFGVPRADGRLDWHVQDEARTFPLLELTDGDRVEAPWPPAAADDAQGAWTLLRAPSALAAKLRERRKSVVCDLAVSESITWGSEEYCEDSESVLDFAKGAVGGASDWAGHCNTKAVMESHGIVPAFQFERAVFELAAPLPLDDPSVASVAAFLGMGKHVTMIVEGDDAALAKLRADLDPAGSHAARLDVMPSDRRPTGPALKTLIGRGGGLYCFDDTRDRVTVIKELLKTAEGSADSTVDASRVICHLPPGGAPSAEYERFVNGVVNTDRNRASGAAHVSAYKSTAGFLADCFQQAFHGLKPATHYFVGLKAAASYSSAQLAEAFAAMLDLGDEDVKYVSYTAARKKHSYTSPLSQQLRQRTWMPGSRQYDPRRLSAAFASAA